jgi:hypothetical protein
MNEKFRKHPLLSFETTMACLTCRMVGKEPIDQKFSTNFVFQQKKKYVKT